MLRLLLILGVCCCTVVFGQDCNPAMLAQCMQQLAGKPDVAMTDAALQQQCTAGKAVFDCLDDYLKRCSPSGADKIRKQLESIKLMLDELCNEDSQLRKDLAKHSSCLQQLQGDVIQCTRRPAKQPTNLDEACSATQSLITCVENAATSKCGSEAGSVIKRMILLGISQDIKDHCGISGARPGVQPQGILLLLTLVATFGAYHVFRF